MRRLFWITVGASAGVVAVRKLQHAADALRPSSVVVGVRGSFADLAEAVQEFGDEVHVAMLEREIELRDALGLNDDGSAR